MRPPNGLRTQIASRRARRGMLDQDRATSGGPAPRSSRGYLIRFSAARASRSWCAPPLTALAGAAAEQPDLALFIPSSIAAGASPFQNGIFPSPCRRHHTGRRELLMRQATRPQEAPTLLSHLSSSSRRPVRRAALAEEEPP